MPSRLVRIVYASRTASGFGPEMVDGILAAARKHNGRTDVTGLLVFSSDHFLQCLEGDRAAVNHVYTRICRDERHEAPELLLFEECGERRFARWSMGYVGASSVHSETVRRFGGSSCFQPKELAGSSALALLDCLSAALRTS